MKQSPDFLIAGGTPLGVRLIIIAIFALSGIGLQLFASVPLGWFFLLLASLFGALKSRSNEPDYRGRGDWQNTTMEELEEAGKLITHTKNINDTSGTFSASSPKGCLMGALILGILSFATYLLYDAVDRYMPIESIFSPAVRGGSLAAVFALDALTFLMPVWIFGRIKAWQPPDFEMRLDQLMYIYNRISHYPELDFQPSLQVVKSKNGTVPLDCKLMIKFKDSDPDFMGIQVQTSLNCVQRVKYPYTYGVIIARPEFDLKNKCKQVIDMPPEGGFSYGILGGLLADENDKKEAKFARYNNCIVELKKEGDVEIAVVRQRTGSKGYTTDKEQATKVILSAYKLAKAIL